ncbi:hypothetical protein LCGC14_0534600 [marine sediment metagenome]|uniref:Uncharacterized protein n=1 Tax=marine sediment metagenome TaxID=412755 RepID=A0A0F9RZ85_9ZZZZ
MTSLERLMNLYKHQVVLKEEIGKEKREINRELRRENKTLFRIGDVLVILMVLFNIGALVITNALVLKVNPEETFTEVNPVAAEVYEFVPATDVAPVNVVYGFILAFFFHIMAYTALITYWMYNRFYIVERKKLYHTLVLLTIWSMLILTDFFNNLGFYIGRLIWGG